MPTIIIVVLTVCVVMSIIIFCLSIRNNLVLKYRIFLIDTRYQLYILKYYDSTELLNRTAQFEKVSYNFMFCNLFYKLDPKKFFTKEELDIAWDGKYKKGICFKGFDPDIQLNWDI